MLNLLAPQVYVFTVAESVWHRAVQQWSGLFVPAFRSTYGYNSKEFKKSIIATIPS